MVKQITHNNKTYFQCEECKMYYENRDIAEKCEKFCRENKACNTNLIKHAVELDIKEEDCC